LLEVFLIHNALPMQKQPFIRVDKRTVRSITSSWFIGNALTVISMTDFFAAPFFQGKFLVLYYLMGLSTVVVGVSWYLYKKQHQPKM
jgi:hypothetical protein